MVTPKVLQERGLKPNRVQRAHGPKKMLSRLRPHRINLQQLVQRLQLRPVETEVRKIDMGCPSHRKISPTCKQVQMNPIAMMTLKSLETLQKGWRRQGQRRICSQGKNSLKSRTSLRKKGLAH